MNSREQGQREASPSRLPGSFRFSVQAAAMRPDSWKDRVRRYEQLGFSTLHFCDHINEDPQWDPLTGMAAVAAICTKMGVGSSVINTGYHEPINIARAGATIAAAAEGGVELGLGAGRAADDYDPIGLELLPPIERIGRLVELVQIVKSLWTEQSTTVDGTYYKYTDVPPVLPLPIPAVPRLLIGGMTRKMIMTSGQIADIVSIFPPTGGGHYLWQGWAENSSIASYQKMLGWAREGAEQADRDPDSLEYSTQVLLPFVSDDPAPKYAQLKEVTGLEEAELRNACVFLSGTPEQAREQLERQRDATGISHYVFIDHALDPDWENLEALSEGIISPLTGR